MKRPGLPVWLWDWELHTLVSNFVCVCVREFVIWYASVHFYIICIMYVYEDVLILEYFVFVLVLVGAVWCLLVQII